VNAGCGFLCTVHRTAGRSARRVGERSPHGGRERDRAHRTQGLLESIDIVIHVDRDDLAGDGTGIRRQVVEIAALVPALRDDFTVEPLFTRAHLGAPLRWTGSLPARLDQRMTRVLSLAQLHAVVGAGGSQ
jgi:hypothetical protein